MDNKSKEFGNEFNHVIQLKERKNSIITGVKKVINFDEKEFFLETIMGNLVIKGAGLEMTKLDTFQGTLSINGLINSFVYIDDKGKKEKNDSLLSKLFK